MKTKLAVLLAVAALAFSTEVRAGALDFLRDHVGIAATNYAFGSPVSAYPDFNSFYRTANTEELLGTERVTQSAMMQLHFVSNRLEAVEFSTTGKERNRKLVAEFERLMGRKPGSITGSASYEYKDGKYRLSYRGLCNAEESMAAIFHLTTESSARRFQEAAAERALGPAVFHVRHASPSVGGGRLFGAHVLLDRDNGAARNLIVKAPPGITNQMQVLTGRSPDIDGYSLNFRTDSSTAVLPSSWRFTLSYDDAARKRQERSFDVVYPTNSTAALTLKVTEAHE